MKSIRIRSAHPKIKSPFIKGNQVFPKDFFWGENSKVLRNSKDSSTKVNTTFDHHNPGLLDQSLEVIKQNSKNRSIKFGNRKYLVPRQSSENKLSRNRPELLGSTLNSNTLKTQNMSFSNINSRINKGIRPIIKSKFQNYIRSSSNKLFISKQDSQTIKLDSFAHEKLNLHVMKQSLETFDNKQPRVGVNNSFARFNMCNNSLLNNSDYLENPEVNMQPQYQMNNVSSTNKIAFKEFKANFLKRKIIPRKLSKKIIKVKGKENLSLNVNLKRRRNPKIDRNNLANRTIEYHQKTIIEEYTDTKIPEFTLGPETFERKRNPIPKPLSVNRMGFYQEWNGINGIETHLSPIKCEEPAEVRLLNFRQSVDDTIFEKAEDEFYSNGDLSSESQNQWDSTKKYIELVDSFRNSNRNKQLDTPSFKCNEELKYHRDSKQIKFEDIINQEIKATQRSSNVQSEKNRWSSETQTYRRSSVTRAESDIAESFGPTSKRIKNSFRRDIFRDSIKIDKNHSLKEINIEEIMKEPRRINTKRKIFTCSQNKIGTVPGTVSEFKDNQRKNIQGNLNANLSSDPMKLRTSTTSKEIERIWETTNKAKIV
jgi:hypothetical protein